MADYFLGGPDHCSVLSGWVPSKQAPQPESSKMKDVPNPSQDTRAVSAHFYVIKALKAVKCAGILRIPCNFLIFNVSSKRFLHEFSAIAAHFLQISTPFLAPLTKFQCIPLKNSAPFSASVTQFRWLPRKSFHLIW